MGRYACQFKCDVYRVHTEKRQHASSLQCSAHRVYLRDNIFFFYDAITLVVLCFITCTSFKTFTITMLSNQVQYSGCMTEQWSCTVANLQPVQVAGKLLLTVLNQ